MSYLALEVPRYALGQGYATQKLGLQEHPIRRTSRSPFVGFTRVMLPCVESYFKKCYFQLDLTSPHLEIKVSA